MRASLDKAKPSSSSSIDDLPAQVELDRLEKERAKPFMKMIGIGIILMVPLVATYVHIIFQISLTT